MTIAELMREEAERARLEHHGAAVEKEANIEMKTPAAVLLNKGQMLMQEAVALMHRKNHDYTSGSGDPYANFRTAASFGVHPAVGIVIRTGDKLQRIRTFAERGKLEVDDEGLKDACIDVINYAVLVYGLLTENDAG